MGIGASAAVMINIGVGTGGTELAAASVDAVSKDRAPGTVDWDVIIVESLSVPLNERC